ncbi:MAG: hypothetical protein R6V28_12820 [Nitriliruptoraceae bacterium]
MSDRTHRTIAASLLARTGTGRELAVDTVGLEHLFDPERRDGLPGAVEWSAP